MSSSLASLAAGTVLLAAAPPPLVRMQTREYSRPSPAAGPVGVVEVREEGSTRFELTAHQVALRRLVMENQSVGVGHRRDFLGTTRRADLILGVEPVVTGLALIVGQLVGSRFRVLFELFDLSAQPVEEAHPLGPVTASRWISVCRGCRGRPRPIPEPSVEDRLQGDGVRSLIATGTGSARRPDGPQRVQNRPNPPWFGSDRDASERETTTEQASGE